jgi:putative N6-adenine-specific DNA methylase
MADYKMVAPCLLGIEGIVADELKRMGANNVMAENGRVLFSGGDDILCRANLNLRTAERVLILIAEFKATTFDELFENVKKANLEDYISKDDAFPVTGYSINSKLHSIPDCQKIIKKAMVERLKSKYGISWFSETGAKKQIRFSIMKDKVSLMLDTSGTGLHKRGYRKNSNIAPIKETLAAAMVDIARVRDYTQLYDPFAGSGTILIEGALKALNIAPGMYRRFACENFDFVDKKAAQDERKRAIDLIKKDVEFKAYGFDIDNDAVELALSNAKKAGVENRISVERKDIRDFKIYTDKATVVCNPPYGERMLDLDTARRIYKFMGQVMEKADGKTYNIISPDEEFEKFFGRVADKKRKLYNGMLKCNLYIYYKN